MNLSLSSQISDNINKSWTQKMVQGHTERVGSVRFFEWNIWNEDTLKQVHGGGFSWPPSLPNLNQYDHFMQKHKENHICSVTC
jgi:hypothetical protein